MNIPAADHLHLREEDGHVAIPLEQNSNDKGCLFAGSIYSGAIIAAYRAAERCFAEHGLAGALVAKTASIRYLKSVVSDGRAAATACGEPLLKPNGNHALSVAVAVRDEQGTSCAEVQAELILLMDRKKA